jgi:NitT/TauT family transport system substrate-binding protein
MRYRVIVAVLMSCICLSASLCMGETAMSKKVVIRFGALPVLQALPLYVAQDKGIFSRLGVNVELIPFSAAAEKDIALSSGNIDGYFGDLVTATVLKGNGRDVAVVATNYDTRRDRRMFGVVVKPGSKHKSLSDLAGVPVALSSNSVVDYVTETLLTSAGIPANQVETIEAKNIGLRMQMLLSGQVEAATLPEALLTAALAKGAVLLADDSGLSASQTVLLFTGPFLKDHPNAVRDFLKAINEAQRLISSDPDAVRVVMVEHVRLPESLRDSYPVPRFPNLHAPDKEAVANIAGWLRKRQVIRPQLTYDQIVNASFIP